MAEICDPLAGWFQYGHIWWHCRGFEDACIDAELVEVSETQARLNIRPSWTSPDNDVFIRTGEYKTYSESGREWRVYCDAVSFSMKSASIRICYIEAPEEPTLCTDHTTEAACIGAGCYWWADGACHGTAEGVEPGPGPEDGYNLPLYGSTTVFGHKFTNTQLRCELAQAVIRPEGLAAKTLVVGGAAAMFAVGSIVLPGSIATTGVLMGGIYVSLKAIDDACTTATIAIFDGTYTEEDHDNTVATVTDDLENAGFTVGEDPGDDFTPEQVEDATTKAEEKVKSSAEEKQRQEDVKTGKKTVEQAEEEREQQIANEALLILMRDNFTLKIPSFVMAGPVNVSGGAPKQNIELEIVAVNKLGGFDWLAADTVLATVMSDSNYQYEATLNLPEFGIIEVYSRIPAAWLDLLFGEDIKTQKHTVFVLTYPVLIAILIIAALVYDKSSGGKLKKILKR